MNTFLRAVYVRSTSCYQRKADQHTEQLSYLRLERKDGYLEKEFSYRSFSKAHENEYTLLDKNIHMWI